MVIDAGCKLGSLQALGSVGAGGMGEGYRARHRHFGNTVAIKVPSELSETSLETQID